MQSTPYTGTVAGMKKSPWLASEDLEGLDNPTLTIEDVIKNENVAMDGGRIEPVLFSLKFKGGAKQMILNATNRRALTQAYGANTKSWRGKNVTVYVQDGVKMAGKVVKGLRIKPHKPDPEPFNLDPTPETPVEKLSRMIAQDKLDLSRVQEWLDEACVPALDVMMQNEAEWVLNNYERLKANAQ